MLDAIVNKEIEAKQLLGANVNKRIEAKQLLGANVNKRIEAKQLLGAIVNKEIEAKQLLGANVNKRIEAKQFHFSQQLPRVRDYEQVRKLPLFGCSGILFRITYIPYLCTHNMCAMKNVTLSIPDDLLNKSRAYAKKHGTTLNQMIRELLSRSVEVEKGSVARSIISHTESTAISMKGYKWNRNDAYEE